MPESTKCPCGRTIYGEMISRAPYRSNGSSTAQLVYVDGEYHHLCAPGYDALRSVRVAETHRALTAAAPSINDGRKEAALERLRAKRSRS